MRTHVNLNIFLLLMCVLGAEDPPWIVVDPKGSFERYEGIEGGN